MSDSRKPFFRFNPNAYRENRCLTPSEEICSICHLSCGWRYTGAIYAAEKPDVVCATCIADGKLAECLHDIELEDIDPALKDELLFRTPGVACFNPYSWPVVNKKPMAFIFYGDDAPSEVFQSESALAAMADASARSGIAEPLRPSAYILLFKEIDGDRLKVVIDPD